jgi:hypothetical protein
MPPPRDDSPSCHAISHAQFRKAAAYPSFNQRSFSELGPCCQQNSPVAARELSEKWYLRSHRPMNFKTLPNHNLFRFNSKSRPGDRCHKSILAKPPGPPPACARLEQDDHQTWQDGHFKRARWPHTGGVRRGHLAKSLSATASASRLPLQAKKRATKADHGLRSRTASGPGAFRRLRRTDVFATK